MRAFILAVAAGVLIFPAAASAQNTEPILTGTAASVHGYKVSFVGTETSAELDLIRTTHGETETHVISNIGAARIGYTAASDLSTATIASSWGPHGDVSLTFTATGPEKKTLPAGCTGSAGPSRAGTLTGTVTAKLDKRFFKTIKITSFDAQLSQGGNFFCGGALGGGFGGPGITALSVMPPRPGGLTGSFVRLGKKETLETVIESTSNQSANWTLDHIISAKASASSLSASGSVKAKGPLLSGTLKFKPGTPGRVSGSFKAKFDSIGTQRFSKKAVATLSKS